MIEVETQLRFYIVSICGLERHKLDCICEDGHIMPGEFIRMAIKDELDRIFGNSDLGSELIEKLELTKVEIDTEIKSLRKGK